jgi:hypothetical protein
LICFLFPPLCYDWFLLSVLSTCLLCTVGADGPPNVDGSEAQFCSWRPSGCSCVSYCDECGFDASTMKGLRMTAAHNAEGRRRDWLLHNAQLGQMCEDAECECHTWFEESMDFRPVCLVCRDRFTHLVRARRGSDRIKAKPRRYSPY